jgi:hypothetical protein
MSAQLDAHTHTQNFRPPVCLPEIVTHAHRPSCVGHGESLTLFWHTPIDFEKVKSGAPPENVVHPACALDSEQGRKSDAFLKGVDMLNMSVWVWSFKLNGEDAMGWIWPKL